jgi:phosphatidylethanolamine/phosphatidyl-N-methylethanolamine N-methyltransferase
MVDAVGEVADGKVILELGPGTGVFSRELLWRYPHSRIVAIEVNDSFANRLNQAVPGITVIRGCASQLDVHLTKLGLSRENVAAVVSGLPLLSLPGELPQQILASVTGVLQPGQRYIQFTYSVRAWKRFDVVGFNRGPTKKIWWNVPPANVLTFIRNG